MRLLDAVFSLLTVTICLPAFAATVTKVDKKKEIVILKLNKSELARIEKGQDLIIMVDGESVDARVEGLSGKSAKLKVLFGIEHLSEESKVELVSSAGRKKVANTEESTPSPLPPAETTPAQSFAFGTGGAEHPWSGELQSPWVLNGPTPINALDYYRSFNFMNPAQTMRVKKYVIVTGLDYTNVKATEKTGSVKQDLTLVGQAVGFTGMMHIHNGFRIGIGYEQNSATIKIKSKSGAGATFDAKSKLDTDVTTLLVSKPIADRYAFGAEYVQTDLKQKSENSDRRSISSNIWRPGVIYYLKDLEIGLKYSPPISIEESNMAYQDPRRILLHVQKKTDSMRSIGGSIEHVNLNGIDDDSVNYVNLRAGTTTHGLPWGGWGVMTHYRSKSYKNKRSANALSLPSYGFSVMSEFTIDRMSAVGFDLSYTTGEGKADKSLITDDKTSIKLQHIAANLTYRYTM